MAHPASGNIVFRPRVCLLSYILFAQRDACCPGIKPHSHRACSCMHDILQLRHHPAKVPPSLAPKHPTCVHVHTTTLSPPFTRVRPRSVLASTYDMHRLRRLPDLEPNRPSLWACCSIIVKPRRSLFALTTGRAPHLRAPATLPVRLRPSLQLTVRLAQKLVDHRVFCLLSRGPPRRSPVASLSTAQPAWVGGERLVEL